jgi:hypothetical protein
MNQPIPGPKTQPNIQTNSRERAGELIRTEAGFSSGEYRKGQIRKTILPGLQSMRVLAVLFLVLQVSSVHAAVYYVSTKGNDNTGNGSSSKPWRTINKAANQVRPGDTVNVLAGVYREHVVLSQDGTSRNRIVFQGERGSKGEWLTIIDPSVELSSGWRRAPEIGTGVYKHTGTSAEIGAVIVDGYNVEGIWRGRLPGELSLLARGTWSTVSASLFPGASYRFWDGVEATWAWYRGVLYIRFRNNDNPNGKDIRVTSLNGGTSFIAPAAAAVRLRTARYNTLRNFHIRGARFGIFGQSVGSLGTSHTIIESNFVQHGYHQIVLNPETARACANNIIRHNVITPHRYGFQNTGGWRFTQPRTWPRYRAYYWNKYQYGNSTSGAGILLHRAGNGNVIHGNTITNCITGIELSSSTVMSSGTIVASNYVSKASGTMIAMGNGWTDTHVSGNVTIDGKYAHRWQDVNTWPSSTTVYVYGNWAWTPAELGSWVYCHVRGTTQNRPTIWVYNNTGLGGNEAVNISGLAEKVGGFPNLRFVNNVFESLNPYDASGSFKNNARMLGAFDYNRVRGTSSQVAAAWYGSRNVRVTSPLWNTLSGARSGPTSFDAGLDLSRTFKLRDVTYPSLPGF